MKHLVAVCAALGTAAVALSACASLFAKGPHVPGAYQGAVQITVANAADQELCVFSLFQDGGATENWLGDPAKQQNLAPGERRTFSVKPGVYHVLGGFCSGTQLLGAMGTYGAATQAIQGPSLIAFDPKPVDPVADAQTLTFTKLFNAPAAGAGGGGGEEPAAEQPAGDQPATEQPPEESSSSESSSSSSPAPAANSCLQSGATCGWDNDPRPCCAGFTCSETDKNGHGWCK